MLFPGRFKIVRFIKIQYAVNFQVQNKMKYS